MGIHQAFFSGYKTVAATHDWSISGVSGIANPFVGTSAFTIAAANLQPNDLVVFVVGADSGSVVISINSGITLTTLVDATSNSISRKIYYGKIGSSVPSGGISGNTTGDYGFAMVFRTPAYSAYTVTVEATNETGTAPSHNNTSVSFDENDLALLIGFVDDDFTNMTPPSDSTKITQNSVFGGSIGSAYKKITADGTYSWGSWTTTGSDSTAAYVLKISPISSEPLWTVAGITSDFSTNYPINNLQTGDLVLVATTLGSSSSDTIPDHPGWTTLISDPVFDEPQAKIYYRKAIVDTSFTIPGGANINSDNIAVVIVKSNKNTRKIIGIPDVAAITGASSGWPTIPSNNISSNAIPLLTNDPLTLAFGFYDENDGSENFGAPTDYTFLGGNANGSSSLMVAYSLEASSGDTAPPGAGNTFANPDDGSDNNSCVVLYAATEDRTVKTWSVVDSEFKDLDSQGSGLTVSNLQQGDFVYWTQSGDNAGTISAASGWFEIFESGDNNPSFKEQTQIIGSGVTSISVTCESDCGAGALIAFRCSSGSTSFNLSAGAIGTGTSGNPVVPDQHFETEEGGQAVTSENDCLCIVSGYLDDDTITSCTAPTGLTLAGFAGGSSLARRSSLMIAYGVSLEDESGPLAGGRAFTTDGSDAWECTAWYVNPS